MREFLGKTRRSSIGFLNRFLGRLIPIPPLFRSTRKLEKGIGIVDELARIDLVAAKVADRLANDKLDRLDAVRPFVEMFGEERILVVDGFVAVDVDVVAVLDGCWFRRYS